MTAQPAGLSNAGHAYRAHSALDLSISQFAPREIRPPSLRLDGMRLVRSGAGAVRADLLAADVGAEAPTRIAFPIHWQRGPDWVRAARNFRRVGLPVVRLWASGRSSLAIGLNPHGVPGIYFTQQKDLDQSVTSTGNRDSAVNRARVETERPASK